MRVKKRLSCFSCAFSIIALRNRLAFFGPHIGLIPYLQCDNSSIKPEHVRQIKRIVIDTGDEFIEIDSVVFIESTLKNAYGAKYINIDAVFYAPLYLFSGQNDLKIIIFDNKGKTKRKLKKKDIRKLE